MSQQRAKMCNNSSSILLLALWLAFVLLNRASAVEFSTVEIANKRITVCQVDIHKERLQLYNKDETGQPFKNFSSLDSWLQAHGHHTLVFAMNAGMYYQNLSAMGLFVTGGRQSVPLNTNHGNSNFFLKPNGVFAITAKGARIIESSVYPTLRERVILATQSGPLLVYNGKIHPVFRANSESRHYRNGVGVPSPYIAIFAISETPVNFYEFATLFRDILHCPNALYLDGSVSSLYSIKLQRNNFLRDLGPIIAVIK